MRYVIISALLICSCTLPGDLPTDLKIVSANLYYENAGMPEAQGAVLQLAADVCLLHEVDFTNIDENLLINAGYTVYESTGSDHTAFNGVIACKIPGTYTDIALSYDAGGFDPYVIAPFYGVRIPVNGRNLAIIGAHIPPAIGLFTEHIEEMRIRAVEDICGYVGGGRLNADLPEAPLLKQDDLVILAGDLNSFPSDGCLDPVLASGLDDGILANANPLDFTWRPKPFMPYAARIDYIFTGADIEQVYQYSAEIPGSDHKAVVMGVNIR